MTLRESMGVVGTGGRGDALFIVLLSLDLLGLFAKSGQWKLSWSRGGRDLPQAFSFLQVR